MLLDNLTCRLWLIASMAMLQPVGVKTDKRPYLKILFLLALLLVAGVQPPASATASERRLALVVGNASYEAHPLATPANDAELITRTLQAAGFEVVHARDLKQDALRQVFDEFLETLSKAGPGSIAFVYFGGYGVQFEGENYLLPIDAKITEASDFRYYGVRLSNLTQKLATLRSKASIIILDAARQSPFVLNAVPLAAGLAWPESGANTLVAFNAAPGVISADAAQGYGPYARVVAGMIKEAGFTPSETFLRVRLRVHELTNGAQVPWHTSNFEQQPILVERPVGQPQPGHLLERETWIRSQTMASLDPQEAYFAALVRDTVDAYADFLAVHGRDPLGKRVLAMLSVRREVITWRRTCEADIPEAYWTYLERYPNGAHGADARRRLEKLGASMGLPAKFRRQEYDIPSPLPDELVYSERSAPSLAETSFLPEPRSGLREIIGDPPEFAFRSATALSTAHDLPVTMPPPILALPAEPPPVGQRDSSLGFDTTQMRPSIDERPVRADLPLARPTSVATRAGLTSELDNKSVAPAVPEVLGSFGSDKLPFWANLDSLRATAKIVPVGTTSEPGKLPAWASQEPIPSDRIMLSIVEPLWTGALAQSDHALPVPTALAQRGRRWVMLTPDAAIPLPLARPGKPARRSVSNEPTMSEPTPSKSTAVSGAGLAVRQSQATAGAAVALRPRSSGPTPTSRSITAREGSPAGTSSAATTSSR